MAITKQSAGHVQATLEVSDLALGAVEVKDGDSDVRLDVELVTLKNAGHTQSEAGGHIDLAAVRAAIELIDHLITANAGNVDAGTQRVTVATDDVNLAAINAKLAALGQAAMAASMPVVVASNQSPVAAKIDQTTPGTTNKVVADVPTATPTVYNVTLTTLNTEYSQAMPANCRRIEFQCRTENTMRFAFVTGKVATPTAPYMTLKAGDYYDSGIINQAASPSTLYLASPTSGVVAEVLCWV